MLSSERDTWVEAERQHNNSSTRQHNSSTTAKQHTLLSSREGVNLACKKHYLQNALLSALGISSEGEISASATAARVAVSNKQTTLRSCENEC